MNAIGLYLFSSMTVLAIAIGVSLVLAVVFAVVTVRITRWALDRPAPETGRGTAFWVLLVLGVLLPFVVVPLSLFWILGMALGGSIARLRRPAEDGAEEDDLATAYETSYQVPMMDDAETELLESDYDTDDTPRRSRLGTVAEYGFGALAALVVLLAGYTAGLNPNGLQAIVTPALFVLVPVVLVLLIRRMTLKRKPALLTD